MLNFLFKRPIAVGMSFLVVIIFSVITLLNLPVSLLPNIDVPQIVVKVNLPNSAPSEIEKAVLRPIREALLTASGIENITSQANSENGQIILFFSYKTNMELAYIEINEKIDQLISRLPKNMPRPQVIRINTSDVPVVRLQIVPKDNNKMLEISDLSEKVLKKRLESIAGVSIVDLNGLQKRAVFVRPYTEKLQALGITEKQLITSIQQNNQDLGAISVKDGQYQYFLQIKSEVKSAENIRKTSISTTKGLVIPLTELASISDTIQKPQGVHFYNNKQAIVITLHKQAQAQMPDLMQKFNEIVTDFNKEYSQADFYITQNQSVILDAGINNLKNDLIFGGFFAFLILFVFIGNYKIPFLIGVILPTSFVMSFLVFYVFNVSVNIISLSGLALGLGMTIDNAIIIFDNIGKKRLETNLLETQNLKVSLLESCVKGTAEMIPPLISSALTTQAVFVPLVFLGGISGALAYDQAVAVGAILLTSLLVSFFLLPLLYLLIFKNSTSLPKEDNRLYLLFLKVYKKIYTWIFAKRKIAFPALVVLGFLGLGIGFFLCVDGLPTIERQEILLKIRWNEALNIQENCLRTSKINIFFQNQYKNSESDIGMKQFLLQTTPSLLQETELYFFCENSSEKDKMNENLITFLKNNYPNATVSLTDAPNAFDLLFKQQENYFEAKFKNQNSLVPISPNEILLSVNTLTKTYPIQKGEGLAQETQVRLLPNYDAITRYNINQETIIEKVKSLLGNTEITQIKQFGDVLPVQLFEGNTDFQQKIENTFIRADNSTDTTNIGYPLAELIKYEFFTDYRSLTADKTGIFHSVSLDKNTDSDLIEAFSDKCKEIALKNKWKVDFSGQYFENIKNIQQLLLILAVSVALLYFILAIEFESFKMPLIVVFTLPLGFMGSFLLLWLCGESLNIMSAMGLTVMLGIIDNESILKIDTINRLRKEMPLDEAITKAGEVTFKPVLMTSLTNILALLPFLFDTGLGADLQKPFVIAIIGGLSIGTFTALFFVPMMYKFLEKNSL